MGLKETWASAVAFFEDGPSIYMWMVPLIIMVSVLVVLCMLKREFGDEIIPLHEGKPLNYRPTVVDLENHRRQRKGLPPLTEDEAAELERQAPRGSMPASLKKFTDGLEEKLERRLYGRRLPSNREYGEYK